MISSVIVMLLSDVCAFLSGNSGIEVLSSSVNTVEKKFERAFAFSVSFSVRRLSSLSA